MRGTDLHKLRVLHNIKTQAELAKILEVSERTITTTESSEEPLSPTLERQARFHLQVELYETNVKDQFFEITQ